MKKWILAFLLLTLLGVAAVAAWRYLLPERHVSDLYRRYHNADGIAASYIHNFPVNDTLTLDVTLLEATTDSAWQALCADFAISDFVETIIQTAPPRCLLPSGQSPRLHPGRHWRLPRCRNPRHLLRHQDIRHLPYP